MRALVWFRSDLRLGDNPALHTASLAATRGVVGVFLLSPDQWREHDWGPPKVNFILRNLRSLSGALDRRRIPLVIARADRFADAPGALLAVAARCGCDALYFNRELEVNERRRDDAATAAFERSGRRVRAFHDQTLLEPGVVRTGEGRFYTVFTPFGRACLSRLSADPPPACLPPPRRQAHTGIDPSPVPDSLPGLEGLDRADLFPAGEAAAERRLDEFARARLGRYHLDRDALAVEGTSVLSPYLSCGVLSVRRCFHAAAGAARRPPSSRAVATGPGVWIKELLWREFYRHLLAGYPRLSMGRAFQRRTEGVRWRDDPQGLAAWRRGRTGVPIVDAAMRQLALTGWMPNRARMIAAMFLTKNLLINWREGERHFMRSLVDGDLASNNGGWQWSASTGVDAAPYFRVFNPVSQGRRFDPSGDWVRRFVPELAGAPGSAAHAPWESRPGAARGYPDPIVDLRASRARAIDAFRAAAGPPARDPRPGPDAALTPRGCRRTGPCSR